MRNIFRKFAFLVWYFCIIIILNFLKFFIKKRKHNDLIEESIGFNLKLGWSTEGGQPILRPKLNLGMDRESSLAM